MEVSLCGARYFARGGKVPKTPLGAATHDFIVLSAPPPDPRLRGGRTIGSLFPNLTGAGKTWVDFRLPSAAAEFTSNRTGGFPFTDAPGASSISAAPDPGCTQGNACRGAMASNLEDTLVEKHTAAAVIKREHIPVFYPRRTGLVYKAVTRPRRKNGGLGVAG